jgi:KUP system potassium uptake protein
VSNIKNLHKLSAAGLLISLGIIYGDIGTSPLYVFKAIIADRIITADLILEEEPYPSQMKLSFIRNLL